MAENKPFIEYGAYTALKAAGHSPAKAFEIVLDAKRGDKYARDWVANARGERS